MEFKEVVGLRRSIRLWIPWRPIEPEKMQAIVEAIYQSPRLLEVDFLKVAVLHRDQISEEDLEAMKTPTTTTQIELCPTYVFIYADVDALERATDGKNLEQLVEVGALNRSHGWTEEHIQSTIIPHVYRPLLDDEDQVPIAFGRGDEEVRTVSRTVMTLARNQIGIAQAYGLLACVDQGLGVQLSGVGLGIPNRIMDIPESWVGASPMLVGYPAESPEAGGQRPREPFEEDYFDGHYGVPFHQDPAVVERLEQEQMIQEPAPLPWRRDELRRVARMFGLPE